MFTVVVSDRAKSDVLRNAEWWSENRSPEQAERWYNEIFVAMQSLEHMPLRCPVAREAHKLNRDIHELLFGLSAITHRIVFEISGDVVRIARVLSTSQDDIASVSDLS